MKWIHEFPNHTIIVDTLGDDDENNKILMILSYILLYFLK